MSNIQTFKAKDILMVERTGSKSNQTEKTSLYAIAKPEGQKINAIVLDQKEVKRIVAAAKEAEMQ